MKVFGTDYDGVIINIEPQKAEAFGALLNKHWQVDARKAAKFWMATGGTSRRYKFDYLYKKQFKKEISTKNYKTIESEYSKLLKTTFYPNLKLLPGALELLKFAKSNFDHTFVSSGVPMEEIQYLVKLNGVLNYFDLILGTNEEFSTKSTHFKEIQSKWDSTTIIFVADSPEDMKVAKEAGAIPIGVLTNHRKEELIRAGASKACNLSDAVSSIKKLLLS